MTQRDLLEIFSDCVNRMTAGWTIEECLAEYPAYALQLRPMLEVGLQVRLMRAPQPELVEDQEIVWQRLMESEPYVVPRPASPNRRGYRVVGQLIAAVFLLILLVSATWFVLNRLVLPPDDRNGPILETMTPTATFTETPGLTATSSPTVTATATNMPSTTASPTVTQTVTQTPNASATLMVSKTATSTATGTLTLTPTPSPTATATGTLSACGEPRTAQDAINAVLAIYPNTTVTSVRETTKFGGTLVWEVKTSHGLSINIDVACGIILTIERPGGSATNTPVGGASDNINANDNAASGGGGSNTESNTNDNSNENDSGDDSGGSGMGS